MKEKKNHRRRLPVKIRGQMYAIYAAVLLIPLTILGILLMSSGNRILREHSLEVLEADNRRVKTLLSEVTTQAYSISEDVFFNNDLKLVLTREYTAYSDFIAAANGCSKLDELIYSNQEIGGIYVYTDNPTVKNYKQFRLVTEEIAASGWYTQALGSSSAFWVSMVEETYTSDRSNLSLVRRMVLPDSEYQAVMVIRLSDSYIRSRIDSSSVVDAIDLDGSGIVYSSRKAWYGGELPVEVDASQAYFRYSGEVEVESTDYFAAVSTLHLYKTNCKLYICTLDSSGYASIHSIMDNWKLLLVMAILIPGLILFLFADYFAHRVKLLRKEMHKARYQEPDMLASFTGNDELAEAFEDLKVMVQDIKEKDARMYESELNAKELRNTQQAMEYKMLASQINPHYLYNTLETIRMKALTSGSRDVADAVKILAKTLRYVQENTGTAFTSLRKELEHVENYLAIQRLRFGERINYSVSLQPGLDADGYAMLPLLLQPVVENAVVHGLEARDGVGIISIDITREDPALRITVRDNGSGMTPEELEAVRTMLEREEADPRGGIALYNIHRRIRLSCGPDYGLQIRSEPGSGTAVTLYLPAESTKILF